ncbi:MAG: ribosome biogenesis GTPase Der, partial [Cetobacterium sp.]
MKPIVAIVGRPNVGKSTLFNKLVGDRIAIVDDQPGVTRDRLYRETEWGGKEFVLVDTGGLEPRNNEFMMTKIRQQAEVAMNEADVILFVVDGKNGLNPLDEEISYLLRKKNKPVILCVNKIDNFQAQQEDIYDFWGLGFEHLIAVSGEHKVNLGDMLDLVVDTIEQYVPEYEEVEGLKLAIIGRPNAGKSSLVNRLCGEERTIVSDIAGTTRDAIDTAIEFDGNKYVLIDTAGIRRKSKVEESLEYYSVLRAIKTIKRADVCIWLLDGSEGLTEQDKRIAGIAHDEKKPIIIVMNKWDTIENKKGDTMKKMREELLTELPFLSYAPVEFISALTGQRTTKILEHSE